MGPITTILSQVAEGVGMMVLQDTRLHGSRHAEELLNHGVTAL